MLWGECFHSFHDCFYNTKNMFSISFRKYSEAKKKINVFTLTIKM